MDNNADSLFIYDMKIEYFTECKQTNTEKCSARSENNVTTSYLGKHLNSARFRLIAV